VTTTSPLSSHVFGRWTSTFCPVTSYYPLIFGSSGTGGHFWLHFFWMGSETTRSHLPVSTGYFRGGHRGVGMVWDWERSDHGAERSLSLVWYGFRERSDHATEWIWRGNGAQTERTRRGKGVEMKGTRRACNQWGWRGTGISMEWTRRWTWRRR
jgi:hypothetical protein